MNIVPEIVDPPHYVGFTFATSEESLRAMELHKADEEMHGTYLGLPEPCTLVVPRILAEKFERKLKAKGLSSTSAPVYSMGQLPKEERDKLRRHSNV